MTITPYSMSPERLIECLEIMGWSQRQLARRLNRDEGTAKQWARGAVRIPSDVAKWLELHVKYHEANPAPVRAKV